MAKYSSKYDLLNASDNELHEGFGKIRFTGVYDTDILSENKETFCGKITGILMEGETNALCPRSLFVPIKFAKYIKPGPCAFYCSLNLKLLRSEKPVVKLFIYKIQNIVIKSIQSFDTKEESLFRRNLKLKNNLFIGLFTRNRDGSYAIRDIRRSDFSKLILQNGKEQPPIVYHPKEFNPLDGHYYEFSWVITGARKEEYAYFFKVDETQPFKEIKAHDVVTRLHDSIMDYSADAGQKIVKMLDTLKNQLTASGKEIFIYELLQNANDYPNIVNGKKEMVDVEFHITRDSLLFMHSGAVFNERNIAAICSINDKEKTDNKETIGYKGIGFKTVFLDNNYVYLQTGDFSFRFDREETREIVDTPWQILPIWTKYTELTPSERYVFTNADKRFRVKFSLRPTNQRTLRDADQNYVKMFQDVFQNERVILFIPYLASVKIFFNGTPEPDITCLCSNNNWRVDNYSDNVPTAVTELINSDIDEQEDSGALKIPTKYYDFTKTKVSFACRINGASLTEVKDTQLYCYLPTKATWGFKFLMNTDMIPTGPRDDIEVDFSDQININEEISEIAGAKFFDWIHDLCRTKQFIITSIFNLIPVFETCIREHGKYKNLISRFKAGFDKRLMEDAFIPTTSVDQYALLKDIILDETGIMSSGIMQDEDFYKITGYSNNYLPFPLLRKDKYFTAFLKRYLKEFECENNVWTLDDLLDICSNDVFRAWISIQENNNRFIEFLLEKLNKEQLVDFLEEPIFIEEQTGSLKCASELFYDVDTYIGDLTAFNEHIPYLSIATRKYFIDNNDWEIVKDYFNDFNPTAFVNDVLLCEEEFPSTTIKLSHKSNSLHFFDFLAKNRIPVSDAFWSLPFINDRNESVSEFSGHFLFFSSIRGREVTSYTWLNRISFEFISPDYSTEALSYFRNNYSVKDFTDTEIARIIKDDDYRDSIIEAIGDDEDTSKAFVDYCYSQKSLFGSGDLRDYPLHGYDCTGGEHWVIYDDNLFLPSTLFDNLSIKEWISNDWMFVLDAAYLKGNTNANERRLFITEKFWVEDLTYKSFYKNVVKKNSKDVIVNTSGSNDLEGAKNIDFIRYLDNQYSLVFEEEKDASLWSGLTLVDNDITDIDIPLGKVYIYDEELIAITKNDWFPNDIIAVCNKNYGQSKALQAIGVKTFKFGEFYDQIIVPNLDIINNKIDTKAKSVAFHKFITDHSSILTPDQQQKMLQAKVFLFGQKEASLSSGQHKILSAKAKELFDKGLVEFSDLDIIDPDYKTEENVEYWETRLGNTKFTVNHFYVWLIQYVDSFSITLNDIQHNIDFWTWVKDNCSDKLIAETPSLPIILKDNTFQTIVNPIYFSDKYLDGSGIESIVQLYDPNAFFISEKYVQEEGDITDWKEFWKKVGIKYEVVDILISSVIPNLTSIEQDNLPKLIADNRDALEKHFEGGLINQLTSLKVKCHDGNYRQIKDTVYVDCEKNEPFTYISIPNQVSFSTTDEKRLIKDIITEVSGICVTKLSDWQQIKLECYLSLQTKNNEDIRPIHYRFIDELSIIRNEEKDSLKELEGIESIYLLDRENYFCNPSSLTMGSVYNPFFDFEHCGITELSYVSNSYKDNCSEYVGRLFRSLHVHCDFQEEDIVYLEKRACALYFWSRYLTKKDAALSRIQGFISDNKFDDFSCIPTKDHMKKPQDLYYGKEVERFVKAIEDWENKVPLPQLPDIKISEDSTLFSKLPFKDSLDFLDGLYALIQIVGQEKRRQLLLWMIDKYDEKYDEKILEYRNDNHAFWKNNKNEDVQIKNLYAIDNQDKTLDQYFGTNPRILNNQYLPGGDSFKSACDILKIKVITKDQLSMEPIDDTVYHERDIDLKLFSLVIAGIANKEKWSETYDSYCELLSLLTLHKCSSIMITYSEDESINQSLRKFYHKEGSNDFYFVDSLDGKRVFTLFVKEFMSFLNVNEDDITVELVEDIMDSKENALSIIKEQNSLMLDEDFKNKLEGILPGIRRELNGNEAGGEVEDVIYRPSFTTNESPITDEDAEVSTEESNSFDRQKGSQDSEGSITHTAVTANKTLSSNDNTITSVSAHEEAPDSSSAGHSITTKPEKYDEPTWLDKTQIDTKSSSHVSINTDTYSRKQPIERARFGQSISQHEPEDFEDWLESIKPKTQPGASFDPTEWKKDVEPSELKIAELREDELEDIRSIIDSSMSEEKVVSEHFLVRYRLYNYLSGQGIDVGDKKAFLSKRINTISSDKGYIYARSARGGLLFVSSFLWEKLRSRTGRLCMFYGNEADDFVLVDDTKQLVDFVGNDNIIIQVKGVNKLQTMESVFNGQLIEKAHILIRVRSNKRYNSLFTYDNDSDNMGF